MSILCCLVWGQSAMQYDIKRNNFFNKKKMWFFVATLKCYKRTKNTRRSSSSSTKNCSLHFFFTFPLLIKFLSFYGKPVRLVIKSVEMVARRQNELRQYSKNTHTPYLHTYVTLSAKNNSLVLQPKRLLYYTGVEVAPFLTRGQYIR